MQRQLALSLVRRHRERALPKDGEFLTVTLPDLVARARDVAAHRANRPKMEVFGSLSSALGAEMSGANPADVDISFTWSGSNYLLEHHPQYQEKIDKHLASFAKEASDSGFSNVKLVRGKIPVVAMVDEHSGSVVDVSINNVGGVQNSKMYAAIAQRSPLFSLYVATVKAWAKSKQVISPTVGCFNSFTVSTMAIMVLMELGLLPAFRGCSSGQCGELTAWDVDQLLAKTPQHPALATLGDGSDENAMADALAFVFSKFAEYYCKFDFQKGVVSLTSPRQLRELYKEDAAMYMASLRELKRAAWTAYNEKEKLGAVDELALDGGMDYERTQRPENSCFVVVDPANFVNCGRRVQLPRKQFVHDRFAQLHNMLHDPATTMEQLLQPPDDRTKLQQVVTDHDRDGARRVFRF